MLMTRRMVCAGPFRSPVASKNDRAHASRPGALCGAAVWKAACVVVARPVASARGFDTRPTRDSSVLPSPPSPPKPPQLCITRDVREKKAIVLV